MTRSIDGGDPFSRIADVLGAAAETSIADLASIGGLNPASDFAHIDLRGWHLAGEDVRGFDFSGSDLRGTGIEQSLKDGTTILKGARLDRHALRVVNLARSQTQDPSPPPQSYTMVRIPNLSDAELLERNFVIRDPLSLNGLSYAPPPTDQWLTYEGRYDIEMYVTCAFGHRHKRGYAFRDELDARYLVGNSCGARHLGMGSWKVFAKGREMLEDRASHLRAVRDLRDLFARNRDWIAGLERDLSVRAFDMARSVLDGRHPALVGAVRAASHSDGGRVALVAQERDFGAEERAREAEARRAVEGSLPPSTERPMITRPVLRNAGVLRGRSVFTIGLPLRQELVHLGRFVNAFLSGQGVSTRRELVETTRNAKTLVRRILAVAEAIEDFEAFFNQTNLELFARWGDENRFDGCRFFSDPGRVSIRSDATGASFVLTPPPASRLGGERLSDLKAAWAGWNGAGDRRRRSPSSQRL